MSISKVLSKDQGVLTNPLPMKNQSVSVVWNVFSDRKFERWPSHCKFSGNSTLILATGGSTMAVVSKIACFFASLRSASRRAVIESIEGSILG
jgi:hypothetical protein